MLKENKIKVCALNVAMHSPHSPEKYIELISKAYSLRKIVKSRGVNGALIGSLRPINSSDRTQGFVGEIYRFILLDPNESWFNVQAQKAAKEDELKEISIPEHLKPHFNRFSFVFFPIKHRLYMATYQSGKTIGPATIKRIFENIFSHHSLTSFGEIEITVEPNKQKLDELLGIPFIHHLKIELTRPNPDDHEEDERRLLEKLEKQNAKKMEINLSSTRSSHLTPDEETKTIARIAASNGSVHASGYDRRNKPVQYSTKNSPWIVSYSYDAQHISNTEALIDASTKMHKQIG